ncbi:hypothetical protein DB30_07837 [Enhygromyxa salina]|uniref:Cytochrome P460 domain-containing protein n=1 Tax=Enhygromyxa salina TaxID=215803 RepID=A0A0C1Z7L3_9BACT|nr:hypothetical protein DB30_07837 [Enhygromyxa salina]
MAPTACTDDGTGDTGDTDTSGGDGDGDGDPGDGDGDPGDGDGDPGDGDGDPTGDGDGDPGGVDEAAIIAEAMGYQSWVLINAAPFMSAGHDGGMATVNVWVPPDLAAQYKAIDPANPMATEFAEGSIIVKEHLDDMGMPAAGTIMYKGPPGYSEGSGDWWWGMGNVLGGELASSGPDLAGCIGCHSPQTTTDWVFGVPPADQNP